MLFSSIFKANSQSSDQIIILNPQEYKKAISDKNTQLVDVRTAHEFLAGHIENAVNIDLFQPTVFESKFEKFDKEKPVYLYCRTGGRSQTAAAKLIEMGFRKVYDLRGGYMAW